MKKEIIDLAKKYITDLNGKTILNCGFTRGDMSLRIDHDKNISIDKDIYVVARIDGTEWKFKYFRQACAFHFIINEIGPQEDEIINEYYDIVRENIGAISSRESEYLQTKIPYELVPDEDN